MTQKETKEAKEPDVFIETMGKVWGFIHRYRMAIILFIAVTFLAGLSYSLLHTYQMDKEEEAQTAFYRAEKKYLDRKEELEKPEESKKKKTAKMESVEPKDLESDFGGTIKAFNEVVVKHPGSQAAILSALNLAEIYEDYDHLDQAFKVLDEAAKKVDGNLLFGFIYLKLGSVLVLRDQCEQAVSYWNAILEKQDMDYLHPYVILRKAFCHEKLGQMELAKEQFKKLSTDFGDRSVGRAGKRYLRWLRVQDKSQARKESHEKTK